MGGQFLFTFCVHERIVVKEEVAMNITGTWLITGVTGFVGGLLTRHLMAQPEYLEGAVHILGLVRDEDKAKRIFEGADRRNLHFIEADLCDGSAIAEIEEPLDFVVHCAAATASSYMISNPVETADGIVLGTRNILELAREKNVKGMVHISSMEVYGSVKDNGRPRTEEELGDISLTSPRSSYPLGKRMAELYCHTFWKEYGVPVKVARLAQTFGIGVRPEDNRVYMQFAKAAMEERDIVLKTRGRSFGNYCCSEDAVSAVLLLLEKGENGETYNVVNEVNTMCIYEMAELVANKMAGGRIKVRVESEDMKKTGYAPDTELRLSGEKLRALGWKPTKSLVEMYKDIIDTMSTEVTLHMG